MLPKIKRRDFKDRIPLTAEPDSVHPSLEGDWQPLKIVGNTAYYYNPKTGKTKSVFVPFSELSKKKKEFADWFKIHRRFRAKGLYGKPVLIPRKEYTKLSRDPLAPFDFSNISKREGVVTQVLSAERFVIDNSYTVVVPGIKIASKRDNPTEFAASKRLSESLVLGQRVFLNINMNNPYDEGGNIIASMDFKPRPDQIKEQVDESWGIFDYLNVMGYTIGAGVRNIAAEDTIFGSASVGDRYSLSDTFTFTRLYHQIQGTAKPLSPTSREETEGEWYEKLALDIGTDISNYISIGKGGISLFGKRVIRGVRYVKPLTILKRRAIKWANTYGGHVRTGGLGSVIDTVNRNWRRVNMLLEPAYYAVNTQLDVLQSVIYGEMNPARYLDINPILKKANNPIFRNEIALKVPTAKNGGYTAKELMALMREYDVIEKSAGIGDVVKYGKQGMSDKFWEPLINVMRWESDRARGAMFIDGLKKGMSPPAAARRVNKFLYDYDPRHLTAFEQAYINRIFPYYIPRTRNLAMIVEQTLLKPYKTTAIAKWQLQQRELAGEDKFKDYNKNDIIQKVGDGKYIRIRYPLEELTQLPTQFSTGRKALLATTYPIFNMFPELVDDKNYFDETVPSRDYPKYLVKKFVSREYYAYRDATNPNMHMSEFLSKHVLGISYVRPSDRLSYQRALIDAGFSPDEAAQQAEIKIKREKYFRANAIRVAAKAHAQSILPPELQDRPQAGFDKMIGTEPMGWVEGGILEKFQFPQFAVFGAPLANIATYVQTGKMGDKGMLDRIPPSATLEQLYAKYPINPNDPAADIKRKGRYTSKILIDFFLDPLWFFKYLPKTGRIIMTTKGQQVLSKEGQAIYAKLNPIIISGRAEGLYGKQAARRMTIEADAKFLKYAGDNPSVARIFMQAPGMQLFGRTFISRDTIIKSLSLFKPIATVPMKGISAIAKEVKEVMAPVGEAVKKKMIPAEKLRIKYMDEFQKRFDVYDTNVKNLLRSSRQAVERAQSQAEIKTGVWTGAKRKAKADPSHGFFYYKNLLSKETHTKLTDFLELGKGDASAQGVVDDIAKEFDRMAMEEIPRGIISKTRENYVYRILTERYKFMKGYTDPVVGRLTVKAPFAKHKYLEGTIAEWNAETRKKHGFDMFEANIWKILRIRKAQHIEAVETYDFLRRIAEEQGISKAWAPFLKNTYGVSSIPTISDVLLPIETIRAIERNPILRARVVTIHTKPGILKWALDTYDEWTYFVKRNLTMLNPKFIPRNTISSIHQNIMKGMYDVTQYLPKRNRQGIALTTIEGRQIYAWELEGWYREYKIDIQPGMAGVPGRTIEYQNAMDIAGQAPRWATMRVESFVRRALYNQKIYEGLSPAQAGRIVEEAHLDYTKQYGAAMNIAARFILFPTWTFGAPQMVGRAIIERPWQFSMMPKLMDAWNNPADRMMLQYRPERLKGSMCFKIPNTEDAFYCPRLATSELFDFALIFHTKEFQFYWEEAMNNPNTLLKFAKYNLDVDWIEPGRGGGSAKKVGNEIVITYSKTGETITAYLSDNKLKFIDGKSGAVIKEYETIGTGNKTAIVTPGEPFNELVRKYGVPLVKIYQWFASDKFKPIETGNPTWDAMLKVFDLTGVSPIEQTIEDFATDEDTPLWAKILDITGEIWFAHKALGNEPMPSEQKIRHARIRLHGNYRGCGY